MEQSQSYELTAAGAEDGDEELVGSFHRRHHPRPPKNSDPPPVSIDLLYPKISTSGSNLSTITNEEQEPEPEPHGPSVGFQVNGELPAGNGGSEIEVSPGAGDGSVAEGYWAGEAWEDELKKQSFSSAEETEVAHRHQAADLVDVGYNASKTELIYEEYDLTEEKIKGREDLIKDFHETRYDDVGAFTQEDLGTVNNGHEEFSDVRLLSPRKSFHDETAFDSLEDAEPIETEYNVKEVLEKQNTHDLFCPNCRSCITRRVILRRKRRRVPRFGPGSRGGRVIAAPEPNDGEPIIKAEDPSPSVPVIAPVSEVPAGATEDRGNDRDPEVFRCLSCFSFFIPTGDGFKLFRIFEKKTETGSMPEPPPVETTDNSSFSFFRWKTKPAVLEGSDVPDTTLDNKKTVVANDSLPDQTSPVSSAESTASPKPLLTLDDAISEPIKTDEGAVESKQGDVIAPSNLVTVVVGQTVISIEEKPEKELLEDLPVKSDNSKVPEVSSPSSQSQYSTSESEAVVVDSLVAPKPSGEVKNDAVRDPIMSIAADSVVVTIERAPPPSHPTPGSETLIDVENPPQAETLPLLVEPRAAEVPEARDFDVLKSIVYGGLVESIASLGVVSSAAGGGAATLNTLALALANLIAGLFVLIHNLIEMKNERAQTDLEHDRYYRNLGRRGKFSLNAAIAILSFIVFGAVAPIAYGFSFRKSDDRDYKLAVVAAASLPCILLLALGKAHVSSKSYIKTVVTYLIMGISASGISFLAGELLDWLLEKLGLFESGSSSVLVSGAIRQMSPSGSGWTSY